MLTKVLFFLNILTMLALVLAYLASYISPQRVFFLALFGLAYPYFLILNIIFVLLWAFKKKPLIIFPLLIITIGWQHPGRYVQFNKAGNQEGSQNSLKVLTWNVQNLARNNVLLKNQQVRSQIFTFLSENKPDILCLQEFMSPRNKQAALIDTLAMMTGLSHHRYVRYYDRAQKTFDAILIFSRFPIITDGALKKDENHNYVLYTDIVKGYDTIRVFNVHLESIRLRHEDYDFLTDMDIQNADEKEIQKDAREILRKLEKAFQQRALQAKNLKQFIDISPFPVIICGDFNDTPSSFAYHTVSKGLTDAFIDSARGFGNTYAGKLPSYRIDYILFDEHFSSYEFVTHRNQLSDHYPVSCYLAFEKTITD